MKRNHAGWLALIALGALIVLSTIVVNPTSAQAAWKRGSRGWWWTESSAKGYATGWRKISSKWFFFDEAGWMKTGWVKSGGKWYYLEGSGAMAADRWVKSGGKWYYLEGSGAMAADRWVKSGGKWYYVGSNGAMLANTVTPDGYRVDNSGAWIQNAKPSGHWETRTVVDQPAWTETIEHPAVTHNEQVWVPVITYEDRCIGTQYTLDGGAFVTFDADEAYAYKQKRIAETGRPCGCTMQDIYETVEVDNGYYETQTIVDKAAWTETVDHPAQTHTEKVWVED